MSKKKQPVKSIQIVTRCLRRYKHCLKLHHPPPPRPPPGGEGAKLRRGAIAPPPSPRSHSVPAFQSPVSPRPGARASGRLPDPVTRVLQSNCTASFSWLQGSKSSISRPEIFSSMIRHEGLLGPSLTAYRTQVREPCDHLLAVAISIQYLHVPSSVYYRERWRYVDQISTCPKGGCPHGSNLGAKASAASIRYHGSFRYRRAQLHFLFLNQPADRS